MPGLKFRVLLDSSEKEEIFHDILLSDEESFESFFNAIISAFAFQGNQMASFYVSNDNWDKGEEISLVDLSEGEMTSDLVIMKDVKLNEYISDENQKFILVYDFLSMWIFLIELVGIVKEAPETPKLILSVGENPKEDSKEISEELQITTDPMDDSEPDEFGFDDFEDGYSSDDIKSFE